MVVICLLCSKEFSCQKNLNRHRIENHGLGSLNVEYEGNLYNYRCLEGSCDVSFKESGPLRTHLKETHNVDDEECLLNFKSYEEFKCWLSQEEKENNVQYLKGTGTKKMANEARKSYFYCVRSGKEQSNLLIRKRFPKTQGSCKSNVYCTSIIIVSESSSTGKCNVKYYKKHYGHKHEIKHLKINETYRQIIASKLMLGIPPQKILSSVRENMDNPVTRSSIITRKDIQNIVISYHVDINNGCRHRDDATSVDLWVNQCNLSESNPVIFYKKQGQVCPNSDLSQQDFCLIIMDKFQADLLKKFGSAFIAMDSTHGLNAYDFELTTILSVDEYHEGMPLAFMFSNKKDGHINEIFFKKIRDHVGIIKTDIFMSDITDVFCNPWKSVMGSPNKQLYCSWHVDRAWQSNLTKINSPEKREWVYKTLKYLQTLLDVQKFQESLECFLEVLNDDSTSKFREYFISYYVKCIEKWAYCFRLGSTVNTNMHLESMYKTLKYHYLQGKKIKRLDKTIHVLMDFLRNKKVERVIKLTKGNTSKLVRCIRLQHQIAMSHKYEVTVIEHNVSYSIKSNTQTYVIRKNDNNTVCCPINCSICCICLHTLSCTCIDYNIRMTICRHIHYIALNYLNPTCTSKTLETPVNETEVTHVVTNLATTSTNTSKLIEEINTRILRLNEKVKDNLFSEHQLKMILKNIKTAESVGSMDTKHFNLTTDCAKEPANKEIAKQISFCSTRKKNEKKKCRRKKPNIAETKVIEETLCGDHLVISIDSKNDHLYSMPSDVATPSLA